MSEEDQSRLKEHMRLAEQLEPPSKPYTVTMFPTRSRNFRASTILQNCPGRSNIRRRHLWSKPSLTEKLTEIAPNLDIYIIPDAASVHSSYHLNKHLRSTGWHIQATDLLRTIFILISVTLTGLFFYQAGLSEANIITLYILGVLLASITTTGWSCSLLASACSVIVLTIFYHSALHLSCVRKGLSGHLYCDVCCGPVKQCPDHPSEGSRPPVRQAGLSHQGPV